MDASARRRGARGGRRVSHVQAEAELAYPTDCEEDTRSGRGGAEETRSEGRGGGGSGGATFVYTREVW